MKGVKTISTILYFITMAAAILYFTTALYALISMLTEWSYVVSPDGKTFAVCFPFTERRFLLGENHWGYKVFNFLLPIAFYGIFFWLLSRVFDVFKRPKLFTQDGINQLKYFYLGNIFAPTILIFLASIFAGEIEEGLEWVAVIHFFLGVFAYFMAAIFKQGLHLQNEQDLYI